MDIKLENARMGRIGIIIKDTIPSYYDPYSIKKQSQGRLSNWPKVTWPTSHRTDSLGPSPFYWTLHHNMLSSFIGKYIIDFLNVSLHR